MFALVDCNNFYASCERVFQPNLNGKPIVILSNNDGCVIARSNEAKKLGIKMGALAHTNEEFFKKNNVHVFSSNYALYGDMSARVMKILSEAAPEIEIYSIDEAFLNFGNAPFVDYDVFGKELREKILRATGLPVSIGFAESKVLSKLANRIAKKYDIRTGNVYAIDSIYKHNKALQWLPVEDIWGIGRQLAIRLKTIGVLNAKQFTDLNDQWVKKEMTVQGLRLKHELLGKSMLILEKEKVKQNIACTRSFEENYTELSDIQERVSTFAFVCAEKLRKQNSNCNAIMVFIHTNEHRDDLAQYSKNIIIKLPFPSSSAIVLNKYALQGLSYIFKQGYSYKKAGVIVMDISPDNAEQIGLFENNNPKHKPLMKAIDALNMKLGNHKVRIAMQSAGRIWKMRQTHLSLRYTTKFKEIISIHN